MECYAIRSLLLNSPLRFETHGELRVLKMISVSPDPALYDISRSCKGGCARLNVLNPAFWAKSPAIGLDFRYLDARPCTPYVIGIGI